jgi:RNAse (barnase) inhibitor barstar
MSIDLPEGDSPPLLQLLPLAAEAGAYSLPSQHVEVLLAAAQELEFIVRRIDLGTAREKDAMLQAIARALEFPDWFGHNWDGLSDCLADLGWLGESTGYVLLFEQAQGLRLASQDDYDTLIEILDEASEGWREIDRPFWSFLSESQAESEGSTSE